MIASLIFSAIALKAQGEGQLNFNVYGGYSLPAKVHATGAYIKIKEGFQYGGGIEYFAADNKSFELKYLRLDTQFPLYSNTGQKLNDSNKGSLNYILFGGTNYFGRKTSPKIVPYAGLSIGLALVSAKETKLRFAWDGKVGVKINATPKVALKLQAFVQSIISTFGSDYWNAPGGGTFATPNLTATFQVGLGAVVCFNISDL